MENKTYWGQAIENMVMNGDTDHLSTGALAVLHKLASNANLLSGVVTISLPMLSDLNAFSQDETDRYIAELVEKKIIVRQQHEKSSEYALHHRLFFLTGEVCVA